MVPSFVVVSYGSAAVGFLVVTILFAVSSHHWSQALWLIAATALTAVWGLAVATMFATNSVSVPLLGALDGLRALAWLMPLVAVLSSAGTSKSMRAVRVAIMIAAVLIIGLLLPDAVAVSASYSARTSLLLLAFSLLVLLGVEQVYRNADLAERRVLIWLTVAIGGPFAYEVFVFSDALLLDSFNWSLWEVRGFVALLSVPFFAVVTKRHQGGAQDLFISRQMVFYSTTLLGAGLYLIAMAVAGYFIGQRGGVWGSALQLLFLFSALLLLALVILSGRSKRSIKVFLAKNFFRTRYDYRAEWLRLIKTLCTDAEVLPLKERCVKAFADILDSPGGELWLVKPDEKHFIAAAAWNAPLSPAPMSSEQPLIKFLARSQWVIDTVQYQADPEIYDNAFPESLGVLPPGRIIVPLIHEDDLVGMAVLIRPSSMVPLNFESHDLLKTVGRQVAVFAVQEAASEALAQTRQFEAVNKLTTFLMHDLKNLVAQQDLMLQNAEKYKHRPEFIHDMLTTVESGVARMKRVLEQLNRGQLQPNNLRVDVRKLVAEVVNQCDDRRPVPICELGAPLWVVADRERLRSAVTHAVRNAQDAAGEHGRVEINVSRSGNRAVIAIRDNGAGMDTDFIRRRLFRPFDTTKGTKGMGIGAYQIREFVRAIGGEVEVESAIGAGTVFRLCLPVLETPPSGWRHHAMSV